MPQCITHALTQAQAQMHARRPIHTLHSMNAMLKNERCQSEITSSFSVCVCAVYAARSKSTHDGATLPN